MTDFGTGEFFAIHEKRIRVPAILWKSQDYTNPKKVGTLIIKLITN